MMEPITIRYGAGINTVAVGNRVFDRNKLGRYEDGVLRRSLVDSLVVAGALATASRSRRHRHRSRRQRQEARA